MLNYNPSQLTDNVTLLEEFHKIQTYLTEHPLYQQYGSQAIYQAGKTDYSLDTVVKPEGAKLGVGDVVIFSNVYYGIVTAVSETTFTVETAVNFRGLQGEQGKQGEPGPQGTTGATGATGAAGKDGTNGTDGADGVSTFVAFVEEILSAGTIDLSVAAYAGIKVGDRFVLLSRYISQGQLHTQMANGTVIAFVNDTKARVAYANVVETTGATGPQGEQGAQGATGATGATGSQGPQGADGLPALVSVILWSSIPTNSTITTSFSNFNRAGVVGDNVTLFSKDGHYANYTVSFVSSSSMNLTRNGDILNINGPTGATGATGAAGKDGNATFLYDGALSASVASIPKAQVTVPSGRSIQVDDIIISSLESTFGAMAQVTAIGDTAVNIDFIGTLQSGGGSGGSGVGQYTVEITKDNFHTITALFGDNLISARLVNNSAGLDARFSTQYHGDGQYRVSFEQVDMTSGAFMVNVILERDSAGRTSNTVHLMQQ